MENHIIDRPLEFVEIWRGKTKGQPVVWESAAGSRSHQDPCVQLICNHSGQRLCPVYVNEQRSSGRNALFSLRPEFLVVRLDPATLDFRIVRLTDPQVYEEYFSEDPKIIEAETVYFGKIGHVEFIENYRNDERVKAGPVENFLPKGFEDVLEAARTKIEKYDVPAFYLTRDEFKKILDDKELRQKARVNQPQMVPGERDVRVQVRPNEGREHERPRASRPRKPATNAAAAVVEAAGGEV